MASGVALIHSVLMNPMIELCDDPNTDDKVDQLQFSMPLLASSPTTLQASAFHFVDSEFAGCFFRFVGHAGSDISPSAATGKRFNFLEKLRIPVMADFTDRIRKPLQFRTRITSGGYARWIICCQPGDRQ